MNERMEFLRKQREENWAARKRQESESFARLREMGFCGAPLEKIFNDPMPTEERLPDPEPLSQSTSYQEQVLTPVDLVSKPKRKRGRPPKPKVPAEPKKRGRPRKESPPLIGASLWAPEMLTREQQDELVNEGGNKAVVVWMRRGLCEESAMVMAGVKKPRLCPDYCTGPLQRTLQEEWAHMRY